MKILITGGTGLIGSAFIERYQALYRFTVLTRRANVTNYGSRVDVISSLASLDNLDEFDVVINLQGEPIAGKRWSSRQKKNIIDSRIDVTQTLTTLINRSANPPHLFISGSAIGFYGRQDTTAIDESFTQCFNEFSHKLCERWEKAATKASSKTRVCLLRTGIVLSERGGALSQMLPSFKMGAGAAIASGKQFMSWIHIDDMIEAINFIIEHDDIHGPVNLTSPQPATNKDFSTSLAKRLNRPCLLSMPSFVMRLLFGEMADLLIYGQHVVPKKLIDKSFQFKHPELNEALSSLAL